MKGKMIPMKRSMVKAILAGRKSETRRPISQIPTEWVLNPVMEQVYLHRLDSPYPWGLVNLKRQHIGRLGVCVQWQSAVDDYKTSFYPCPYGDRGDVLLVRESAQVLDVHRHGRHDDRTDFIKVCYNADGHETDWIEYPERLKWRPEVGASLPRGVYREAARIQLRITDVVVERLQDITDEGILAEGIYQPEGLTIWEAADDLPMCCAPIEAYIHLWDYRLYLDRGPKWAENPWVFVVRFERVEHGQE